ncbi:hypothetical protein Slin15195_G064000 [Septoria linicola]|uniref:Uncharacterized protein n=1 Tax=Septoria linicola TaxID=215465 RepID=A0A9Q9AYP8_9PEZI|nr:hypothetical protein Slin14017_G114320 [Septoria linicola]USW53081.1 hypothetical protein Slin15195_G064000 [Septoria linicola]
MQPTSWSSLLAVLATALFLFAGQTEALLGCPCGMAPGEFGCTPLLPGGVLRENCPPQA